MRYQELLEDTRTTRDVAQTYARMVGRVCDQQHFLYLVEKLSLDGSGSIKTVPVQTDCGPGLVTATYMFYRPEEDVEDPWPMYFNHEELFNKVVVRPFGKFVTDLGCHVDSIEWNWKIEPKDESNTAKGRLICKWSGTPNKEALKKHIDLIRKDHDAVTRLYGFAPNLTYPEHPELLLRT